jgi:hypothetical protein
MPGVVRSHKYRLRNTIEAEVCQKTAGFGKVPADPPNEGYLKFGWLVQIADFARDI